VDGGREIFSKRLSEGPEQRFPQRDVVGELDAILDMTDGKTTDRWPLPGLMQIVNDSCEHGHQSADLNANVLLE
jgi:hypothetical protein